MSNIACVFQQVHLNKSLTDAYKGSVGIRNLPALMCAFVGVL